MRQSPSLLVSQSPRGALLHSRASRNRPLGDQETRRLGDYLVYLVAAFLLVLLAANTASACPVCYGAPGDPMVKGTNNGVWVLLGIVGFVQVGFVAMFWSFWRRARAQKKFRDQFHVIEGGPHP